MNLPNGSACPIYRRVQKKRQSSQNRLCRATQKALPSDMRSRACENRQRRIQGGFFGVYKLLLSKSIPMIADFLLLPMRWHNADDRLANPSAKAAQKERCW